MRVLIGLREVSGYCANLHQGMRSIGVDATFINLRPHPHRYADGVDWPLVRLIRRCTQRYRTARLMKPLWGAAQMILSAVLLLRVISRFDVFIFVFGTSFLLLYDLPLLRLLGKKIIFVCLGTDVRPPYLNGAFIGTGDRRNVMRCVREARRVRQRVHTIDRYADAVISMPSYGLFHCRPFVFHSVIGFPSRDAASVPVEIPPQTEGVRILHSPSNPILKGTSQIQAAVERLRAKGYAIEWVTISGQPNEVVLRELARCDFVIDQLYGDWLMPGFVMEAGLAGKPAITAGYDLQAVRDILPPEHQPPVHACHPDDIEAAIEKLILDREYRLELGRRAKEFVEANWSAPRVAERFLRLINGDYPAGWRCDPARIRLFHGGGVSQERLLPFLKAYIEHGGRAALQLSDKPEMEAAFIEFVARS